LLIEEANQSLEEAGTPSHEVSVVILHREIACGSLGITLAGGADYETKEITVSHKSVSMCIIHLIESQFLICFGSIYFILIFHFNNPGS
jgi:hypothetical protein